MATSTAVTSQQHRINRACLRLHKDSQSQKGFTMGIAHWHVTKSLPGYLPESDPITCTDAEGALDALAHELDDYADSFDDQATVDDDVTLASALKEIYCTCRQGERSAEHHDALIAINDGRGICNYVGTLVFELSPCSEHDCLKYCPDAECRNVAGIEDQDHACWVCGAEYVAHDACTWFEAATA